MLTVPQSTSLFSDLPVVIHEGLPRANRNRRPGCSAKSSGRTAPFPQFALDDGVTVVLFAGLGGVCQGLEEAGCPVNVANNHDDVALAAHAAIHPHTTHIRGSIFDVDPIAATGGKPVKVLWGSPDCRNHSPAAGGAPRSPAVRSLPWQICRWAAKTHPQIIFIENVPALRTWGKLVAKRCKLTGRVIKLDGSVAEPGEQVPVRQQHLIQDPKGKGKIFRQFVAHLRKLGGLYEDRDMCAADYGVPTSRTRYFAVIRFDGRSIGWPTPTHAPTQQARKLKLKPWVPAAQIIDWSLPIPSVFARKKELAAATLRRVAIGLRRFVLENPDPFIIHLTHAGTRAVHPLSGPLPTITSANRGELALCSPKLRKLSECYLPGEALEDAAAEVRVLPWLVQHNLGMIGHPVSASLSTLTTRGTQQQIAAAFLVKLRGTSTAVSIEDPLPTFSAGGNHVFAVAAILERHNPGIVARGSDGQLIPLSVTIRGEEYVVVDIGMRGLEPYEAARAHELELPKEVVVNGKRRPLTKTEAMRLIGNSVPKRMARLLAEANSVHHLYLPSSEMMAAD